MTVPSFSLRPPAGIRASGAGYAGRFALHEYFVFAPEPKEAFTEGEPADGLAICARRQGCRSAFAEAASRAVEGITSLDEVLRILP